MCELRPLFIEKMNTTTATSFLTSTPIKGHRGDQKVSSLPVHEVCQIID